MRVRGTQTHLHDEIEDMSEATDSPLGACVGVDEMLDLAHHRAVRVGVVTGDGKDLRRCAELSSCEFKYDDDSS